MDRILDLLIDAYKTDVETLCWAPLWIPLMIPAAIYACVMVIKWTLLTMPVWLPFSIIVSVFRGLRVTIVRKDSSSDGD